MKVAVTADVHLTTRNRNPERFQVLENILESLRLSGIDILIIAGDLFDASSRDVSELESLCSRDEFRNIKLYIIPGNHDPTLNYSQFTLDNLTVFSEPEIVRFAGDAIPILFVPYIRNMNMGEVISTFADQLVPDSWILVGHGDWSSGLRMGNPYEPGVFMPLTRQDIETFRPASVFLGHIHSPIDRPPVYYVGSPCGLDITETGYRRILLSDLSNGMVEEMAVDTPHIYFNETFIIVPVGDEEAFLQQQIEDRIQSWELKPGDEQKVRLRIKVNGYSVDRRNLLPTIMKSIGSFKFYNDEEADLSEVLISTDSERNYIADSVKSKIENLQLTVGPEDPSKEEIILDALHFIYGD